MIIDSTYFVYEREIPNLLANPNLISEKPEVDALIVKYELQFLTMALGYSYAKNLLDQFQPDGSWKVSAEQKYIDLVDGKDEWQGFRIENETYPRSIIADYVYCSYLYYKDKGQLTSVGNTTERVENSNLRSNWYLFVPAWREMYDWYQDFKCYMDGNETDFPTWRFTCIENVNTFDL